MIGDRYFFKSNNIMEYQKPDKLIDFKIAINKGNIFHGHGGSNNVVITYKDNAIKLIPKFKKPYNAIEDTKNDQEEIKFYKEFTKHLIQKDKTPHIVAYYGRQNINLYDFLDENDKLCRKKTDEEIFNFDEKIWDKLQKNIQRRTMKQNKIIKKTKNNNILDILKFWKKKQTKKQPPTELIFPPKKKISKKHSNLLESGLCDYNKVNKQKNIRINYWNWREIEPKCDIVYLEKCPETIPKLFKNILATNTNKEKQIQEFIDRVMFQIIFTLCAILEKYPSFVHNDCFIRNILAVNENKYKSNEYVKYVVIYDNNNNNNNSNKTNNNNNNKTNKTNIKNIKNIKNKKNKIKTYYLPANGICIKLNDFGYSMALPQIGDKVLNGEIKHYERLKSESFKGYNFVSENTYNNDLWNFIRNFYRDDQFNSMTELIKKSKLEETEKNNLINIVKETLSKYFDIEKYDSIKNRILLHTIWDIKHIKELHNIIQPSQNYFMNDFNFKDYRTLNGKNKIIKTFTIKITL